MPDAAPVTTEVLATVLLLSTTGPERMGGAGIRAGQVLLAARRVVSAPVSTSPRGAALSRVIHVEIHAEDVAVLTMGSEDYHPTHERVMAAGGQVAHPQASLRGMAWQGYYLDTEGNVFGVHQPDPEAR